MKTFIILLCLAAVCSACIPLDGGLGTGPNRNDTGRGGPATRPGQTQNAPACSGTDTTLYYSAVRFPPSYDWQRDTAYGNAGFELLLCREGTTLLTLPSGPQVPFCADPDRHHILDGRLYTERMLGEETLIGRDGVELFRFEGREFLLGLLADGEDLYTLSRPVSGRGFSFRLNGRPLLTRADGDPFGNLTDPSYSPGGALYRDNGQTVFAFRAGYITSTSYYLVRDGVETRLGDILPGRHILDLKQHGGRAFVLYPSFLKNLLYEGRIWPEGDSYAITGRFSDGTGGSFQGWLAANDWTVQRELCRTEAVLYHSPEATCGVTPGTDGMLRWHTPDGGGESPDPCHFFSPACATLAGSRFALALNPRDIARPPRILDGTRTLETDLYGYVSRVTLEISPPN
ncbi:MAG: hypothetical protein K5849_03890 [Bacteroidales bacterium]|nr:hypothetical protein [Bacteroidales bacterium]